MCRKENHTKEEESRVDRKLLNKMYLQFNRKGYCIAYGDLEATAHPKGKLVLKGFTTRCFVDLTSTVHVST